MRTLLVVLIILMGFSVALAQTPPPSTSIVTVTTFTGADGTSGSLTFTVSGTFQGDPLAFTLDQPGDLQPGLTNAYSFSVPYDFCQLFQFSLRLVGDDWLGERLTINVNGIDVWFNGRYGDSGAMTATVTRGGTWDGTDAYRAACPTLPIELSLVTGDAITGATSDAGTVDTPWFYLQGDFSASPYAFILNQPDDLQPGQTDTYIYRVPMSFCQMTGWQLTKAASGAEDDPWLPNRIDLTIDDSLVFFDAVFNEVGPIMAEEGASGTWDATDAHQSRCAPGVATTPPLAPTSTALPTITTTSLNAINQLQTIVPVLPGGLPQVTPELGEPPLAITPVVGIAQCPGTPASRLEIGGVARVTPGAPNRVRAQASTSSAILGNMPAGTAFIVLAGPVCADGYAWWQVNFNGIIGWTAEGSGAVYFLEPA
jgi:hypothetical protein